MMERVARASGWLLSQVRVNRVRSAIRGGERVFIKRRRAVGTVLIWFGNRLLALARGGTHYCPRVADWIRWETVCVALLYPDRDAVTVEAGHCLVLPALGGVSLRTMLRRADSSPQSAFVLAARELRRVHTIHCGYYGGGWSHGDLHLDNILYDKEHERAYVIDFDIRHEAAIEQRQRHADDLKSVLLELLGQPSDRWVTLAEVFLKEYGDRAVLDELRDGLIVPQGLARVLFYIKTNGAPLERVGPRLQTLRHVIQRVIASSAQTRLGR